MAKAKFVDTQKALPKIQQLGTLARKRIDLQRQMEGLKAQLDAVESNIRFLIPTQEHQIVKSQGQWYECYKNKFDRTTYNADKLREKVSAAILKKCEQTVEVTTLSVKPVSEEYILSNYDF